MKHLFKILKTTVKITPQAFKIVPLNLFFFIQAKIQLKKPLQKIVHIHT